MGEFRAAPIFVIARVFDSMQFDNMLQKCFDCSYGGSASLPTTIVEPSFHWTFACLKSPIETLKQNVKSVQIQQKRRQMMLFWCLYC